jgi:hypothetical protein
MTCVSTLTVRITVLGLVLCLAPTAQARPCASEADCPLGFMCLPFGTNSDGGVAETCQSLSCQSDADCGSGTRCEFNLGSQCVPASDGGQSCKPFNACVPQWQAPCAVDDDCGPGFTCAANTAGLFACGPNQAEQVPPYATATPVPCESAQPPIPIPPSWRCDQPDAGALCIPNLCDAGSTCLSIQWNTCAAQQTGPCTVDSDCPPTWTCECPSSCGQVGGNASVAIPATDAAVPAAAAGCTKQCVAPNSDLQFNFGACFGNAGAVNGSGTTAAPGAADGGLDAGAPPSAAMSARSGGCRVGGGAPASADAWATFAAWCAALWLGPRRRVRRVRPL